MLILKSIQVKVLIRITLTIVGVEVDTTGCADHLDR
jgi:hypothetical protein